MVPGGITGYLPQAVPHSPQVSSSVSLHCAHVLLLLFHFSTANLLLLVVFGVSGCLESSEECHAYLYSIALGRGHFRLVVISG